MIPSVVVDRVCVASETVGLYGAEQPPVSEAIVDLVLLAALMQFKYPSYHRLFLPFQSDDVSQKVWSSLIRVSLSFLASR